MAKLDMKDRAVLDAAALAIREEVRNEVPRALRELGEEGLIGRWVIAAMMDHNVIQSVRRHIDEEVSRRVKVSIEVVRTTTSKRKGTRK